MKKLSLIIAILLSMCQLSSCAALLMADDVETDISHTEIIEDVEKSPSETDKETELESTGDESVTGEKEETRMQFHPS